MQKSIGGVFGPMVTIEEAYAETDDIGPYYTIEISGAFDRDELIAFAEFILKFVRKHT